MTAVGFKTNTSWVAIYIGLLLSCFMFLEFYFSNLQEEEIFATEQVNNVQSEVKNYIEDMIHVNKFMAYYIAQKPHEVGQVNLADFRKYFTHGQYNLDYLILYKLDPSASQIESMSADTTEDSNMRDRLYVEQISRELDRIFSTNESELVMSYLCAMNKSNKLHEYLMIAREIKDNHFAADEPNSKHYAVFLIEHDKIKQRIQQKLSQNISVGISLIPLLSQGYDQNDQSSEGLESLLRSPEVPLFEYRHYSIYTLLSFLKNQFHFVDFMEIEGHFFQLDFANVGIDVSLSFLLSPYLVLIAGMVLTLLLAVYLHVETSQRLRVQELAVKLEKSNTELETRIVERDQISAALKESEKKYREMYENAVDGTYQAVFEGKVTSSNPAYAKILGYRNLLDLLQHVKNIDQEIYVDKQARERFKKRLLKQGHVIGAEFEVYKKNKKKIWISETARLVKSDKKELNYLEGKIEDISFKKSIEKKVIEAKETAELANRSKSEFLANISHELRTPLNAIIGFSEIIRDQIFGKIAQPEYAEYSKDIYDSGKLLLEMINDILDMSKIEAGKKELKESKIFVPRVVESCVRLIKQRAIDKNISIMLNLDERASYIRAEELAVKQMITNLVTNAIKFTPPGGVIFVSTELDKKKRILISIKDTGVGMTAEGIRVAKTPFGQVTNKFSDKNEGLGLGIPIVNSLIHLHQGEMLIRSKVNKGTVFTLVFPANRLYEETKITQNDIQEVG